MRLPGAGAVFPEEAQPLAVQAAGALRVRTGRVSQRRRFFQQALVFAAQRLCAVPGFFAHSRHLRVGGVHRFVSVLRARLRPVGGFVVRNQFVPESLEFFTVAHRCFSFHRTDRFCHVRDQRFQTFPLLKKRGKMNAQRGFRVVPGGVQDPSDLLKPDAELPVKKDLLQPVDLFFAVEPAAVRRGSRGRQQADLAVVAQRARAHAGEPGQRVNRIFHLSSPSAEKHTR